LDAVEENQSLRRMERVFPMDECAGCRSGEDGDAAKDEDAVLLLN
jgi:hypothetical protein